jgi:hypothetical protein
MSSLARLTGVRCTAGSESGSGLRRAASGPYRADSSSLEGRVRGRRSASEARPGCSERATAPLADRANINEELVDAARLQVAELQRSKDSGPGGPTVELGKGSDHLSL